VRFPRLTVVLAATLGLLAAIAPAGTTGDFSPVAWTDELGADAVPGPLHYVAIGDSFSSGEGAPYVDRDQADEWKRENMRQECTRLPGGYPLRCVDRAPSDKETENAVGWLGDTGTDVAKLEGRQGRLARLGDGYSFGGNNCHRSAHAYPARVWERLDGQNSDWGVTFAACSGAETIHFDELFRGEAPQRKALERRPADLVTVGFGGNDIGFGEIVSCIMREAAEDQALSAGRELDPGRLDVLDSFAEIEACSNRHGPELYGELEKLSSRLGVLYSDIRTTPGLLAQDGRVIAIGYPRLFPFDPPSSCSLGSGASVGRETMLWLNEVADRLNDTIERTAGQHGIEYVDTADIIAARDQGNIRHDFCVDNDGQRWVNRLVPSDLQRSVHPTFQYHERVTERVLACWNRSANCTPRL